MSPELARLGRQGDDPVPICLALLYVANRDATVLVKDFCVVWKGKPEQAVRNIARARFHGRDAELGLVTENSTCQVMRGRAPGREPDAIRGHVPIGLRLVNRIALPVKGFAPLHDVILGDVEPKSEGPAVRLCGGHPQRAYLLTLLVMFDFGRYAVKVFLLGFGVLQEATEHFFTDQAQGWFRLLGLRWLARDEVGTWFVTRTYADRPIVNG